MRDKYCLLYIYIINFFINQRVDDKNAYQTYIQLSFMINIFNRI